MNAWAELIELSRLEKECVTEIRGSDDPKFIAAFADVESPATDWCNLHSFNITRARHSGV